MTPTGDEIRAQIRNLGTFAHASVVMVHMAVLEDCLEAALLGKMHSLNREMRDRLFTGYGPLSSLSAKIDVGFALALLDRVDYDRLTVLRKIRNKFAHSPKGLRFEDDEIKGLLVALPGWTDEQDGMTFFGKQTDELEAKFPHPAPA